MFNLREYLLEALMGFKTDPASSAFQKGYEACLKELWKVSQPDESSGEVH